MKKALITTHNQLKSNKSVKTLQFLFAGFLSIAFCLPLSSFAGSKISIASGNWENAAIWNPSGVPSANDNVTIGNGTIVTTTANCSSANLTVFTSGQFTLGQGTRMTIGGNITIDGRMNMNRGMITLSSTGRTFKISSGGTFIWDPGINTSAEATLFTSCTENFDANSSLVIKNWYNYTIPLAENINGNLGNVEINSPGGNNSIVEWNQNNKFESHKIFGTLTIDQGWITLDKSGSISNTTIGNIILKNVNSVFYTHNGTHLGSFSLHCSNIQNNGGVFYGLNDGDGNITIHVTGNFNNSGNVKIINNSGIPNISNGNAVLNVEGIFTQTTGDTRILYNIATTTSGTYNATFGDLNLNGGIFMGQTGCHTGGLVSNLNVTRNFNINFQSGSDKFRGASLSSIAGTLNNIKFKLTVGGNFIVNGIANPEITSSAASGNEEITIHGNYTINGCDNSLNYGSLVASHNLQLTVDGTLNMNGGTLVLSKNYGQVNAAIKYMNLTGGTLSVKNSVGIGTIQIIKDFNQSGGEFIFHHNPVAPTSDNINVSIAGTFAQSSGLINFDDNTQSTAREHTLSFKGQAVNLSGNGRIIRSGNGNSNIFGLIKYSSTKTQNYTRTGTTHTIENVIQSIEEGCKVSLQNCQFVLASNNQSGLNMLHVKPRAILDLNKGQIASNKQYGFSRVYVDSSATIITRNTFGFYDQTTRSSINFEGNMNYDLNQYSIVEYNSTENLTITGMPANSPYANSKYGILRVNLQGPSDPMATIANNYVFVRTKLDLVYGGVKLNANTITIENGAIEAISRYKGYIYSEGTTPVNNSIVCWKKLSSGAHQIPFGFSSTKFIPVTFTVTNGLGKEIYVSTRRTPKDNRPYPALNMTFPGGNPFATEQTVDRWWSFTGTTVKADITVTYLGEENSLGSSFASRALSIIQWKGDGWNITTASSQGVQTGIGNVTISNTPVFSDWTIASVAQASIDLNARMSEDNDAVAVNWHIQSETGIDKFVVERSEDGINFIDIDELKASFDSKIRDYSYDDITFKGTEAYYRLKQVGPDGSFIYSRIAKAEIKTGGASIKINSVSPNPFTNLINVSIRSDVTQKITISLYSSDGKIKFIREIFFDSGENTLQIDNLESLQAGNYILVVESAKDKVTKKIIKN